MNNKRVVFFFHPTMCGTVCLFRVVFRGSAIKTNEGEKNCLQFHVRGTLISHRRDSSLCVSTASIYLVIVRHKMKHVTYLNKQRGRLKINKVESHTVDSLFLDYSWKSVVGYI